MEGHYCLIGGGSRLSGNTDTMAVKDSCFALFLMLLVAAVNAQIFHPMVRRAKPGTCPSVSAGGQGGAAQSQQQCSSDFQCPGAQKCCQSAFYGSVCRHAPSCANIRCAMGQQCVNTATGPVCRPFFGNANQVGVCPRQPVCPSVFPPGLCTRPQCSANVDCPVGYICCRQCSCNVCVLPRGQQSRPCTSNANGAPGQRCGISTTHCTNPPCSPQQRCIASSKPGRCPARPCPLQGQTNGLCTGNQCQGDSSCPGSQKCCNVCGCSRCTNVASRPRSCRRVRCGQGQVCQMQAVFCFRGPCPRRPVCRPNPFLGLAAMSMSAPRSGRRLDS